MDILQGGHLNKSKAFYIRVYMRKHFTLEDAESLMVVRLCKVDFWFCNTLVAELLHK